MKMLFASFVSVFGLLVSSGVAQETVVSLDHGTFKGAYSSQYNVTIFRRLPFAAPPVGENRFRAPQPPLQVPNGTVYNSDRSFDFCPQRTTNGSEDCLYLSLYSKPWTKGQSLRPVVVFYHGGGNVQGGGSIGIPPSGYPVLNVSAQNDLVFVYPTYRVAAFGFLPGKEIADSPTSDLNAGLLDQQAALTWVNKNVAAFGGDPNDVTIWGQSAGGGAVVAQVIANGGKTSPSLFNKAVASSPWWPKTYAYDSPESQDIYDKFAAAAGCAGPESLKCLKKADLQTLRDASLPLVTSHQYNSSYFTWGPVVDGKFLTQTLSQATMKKEVNADVAWGLYNTHEGENFIPAGFGNAKDSGSPPYNSSIASFNGWVRGLLPDFSERNIQKVLALYPPVGSSEGVEEYNTTTVRAGLVFRDITLACPAYWVARAAKKKSYVAEYTISPAKHASETNWYHSIQEQQKTQPTIYQGFTGALASLFQFGDPNANKLTNSTQSGVPENWRTGEQFVISSEGLKSQKLTQLAERCGFWRQVADQMNV